MIIFEFRSTHYSLTERRATRLAENLRNYARGTLAPDVRQAGELSGNPNWADGALAVADVIEDALVGNFTDPIPLEGKAAEATCWALRLMPGLAASAGRPDAATLRDALAEVFPGKTRREAA